MHPTKKGVEEILALWEGKPTNFLVRTRAFKRGWKVGVARSDTSFVKILHKGILWEKIMGHPKIFWIRLKRRVYMEHTRGNSMKGEHRLGSHAVGPVRGNY